MLTRGEQRLRRKKWRKHLLPPLNDLRTQWIWLLKNFDLHSEFIAYSIHSVMIQRNQLLAVFRVFLLVQWLGRACQSQEIFQFASQDPFGKAQHWNCRLLGLQLGMVIVFSLAILQQKTPVFSYIFFFFFSGPPFFLQVYPILVGHLFGSKFFVYWFRTHGSASLVECREGRYIYISSACNWKVCCIDIFL